MTVRDWIVRHSASVPDALTERVLDILGGDGDQAGARTGELCLAAATRSLEELLADARYGRDGALHLLAIDALMTFAFEHAGESDATPEALRKLASHGARTMAQLATARG